MKPKILITAPHATCDNYFVQRMCDTRAYQAVLYMKDILKNMGIDVVIFNNDQDEFNKSINELKVNTVTAVIDANLKVERSLVDMNRVRSRDTSYRKNLSILMANLPINSWVIDIHSFPYTSDYYSFGENNFVVILDNIIDPDSKYPNRTEMSLIYDNIKNISHIKILEGSLDNDIQKEARDMPLRSLLFEFCENKEYLPDEELYNDVKVILKAIIKTL